MASAAVIEVSSDEASGSLADRLQIRELIENWVVWRDAGEWERFATVWHSDGEMIATWFQAKANDFIEGCKKAFDSGVLAQHSLGGSSIDISNGRAVAHTKMEICQRGKVHGTAIDVICQGRFVDAFEKRDGRWGLVFRQPVYELDRMIPLEPGASIRLDEEILHSFPVGYQHLGYLQSSMGLTVNRDLPGTRGAAIDALRLKMRRWLDEGMI